MARGSWDGSFWRGQIFWGPLAASFPGVTRIVQNPVVIGRGIISGDLDHPIFSLVCNPHTGIRDWSAAIWDRNSPWGPVDRSLGLGFRV
jgi:hypothetical protein